jgi:hypothetical protein
MRSSESASLRQAPIPSFEVEGAPRKSGSGRGPVVTPLREGQHDRQDPARKPTG